MYSREDYKNKIRAMYDENNHITTRNLLDLIEEAIVDTTARPQEEFKQPTWNDFWDAACKECRDGMMQLADNLVEACETGRDNSPEWQNLYERVTKIRENMDEIPKDYDGLGDYVAIGETLDWYGNLLGCERKKNESNDVFYKRICLVQNIDHGEMKRTIDSLKHRLSEHDDVVFQPPLLDYELDQFIEWLDNRCSVAWSRKTAMKEFTKRTPLWQEYVEERKAERGD